MLLLRGAVSMTGKEDAEGDLVAAVRAVVGQLILISTGVDLHGNVSSRLART